MNFQNIFEMVVLIILLLVFPYIAATNYCNLCADEIHTLCKYPNDGPAKSCIDYKSYNLSNYLQQYIVNIHNDIRNHVASGFETKGLLGSQPSAANMLYMQWDDELAKIAQRWADQCISPEADIQHDECKKTDRFEFFGQNILIAITTDKEFPDLSYLILNWYNQIAHVVKADIEHFVGLKRAKLYIGQYTQLVWAKSQYVGCGLAIYGEKNNTKRLNNKNIYYKRLVCNYAPAGNVLGEQVYEIGIPCSKCPYGKCNGVRTSLCAGPSRNKVIDYHRKQTFRNILTLDEIGTIRATALRQKRDTMNEDSQLLEISQYSKNYTRNLQHTSKTQGVHIQNYTNNTLIETSKDSIIIFNDNVFPQAAKKRKHSYVTDEDILIMTNISYHRIKGKWHNGLCRCDIIYRSSSKNHILTKYILIFSLIVSLNIFLVMPVCS